MPTLKYKDVQLHYEADSNGKENVVFIHGFLEDHTMWRPFCEPFPPKYRKIFIDLPGFGKSDSLAYVHTMEEMAEAVKFVLDHLKIRRVTLVGHSMGGYVSLAFTEKYPDAVRGIVLYYSSPFADSESKQQDRDRAIQAVKQEKLVFIQTAIPNLFAPESKKAYEGAIAALTEQAKNISPRGIVAALEGMKRRLDREVLLHFGPCDVLIVAGAQDPVLPISTIEPLFTAPKVTAHCVTSGGHMGHIEDAQVSRKALLDFLKRS
jgi:pimeloyl-ACP methyl ester carboxylesterase